MIFASISGHFDQLFENIALYRVLPVKHFYRYRYRLTVGKVKMLNSNLYPQRALALDDQGGQ